MLRSGLETLGPEFELIDIPSGEEALLEASRQPIQLLIADVRLAGMTGLELREKILKRSPGLKVILITGVTDPNIRRQVADAGADAFFLKPIEMSDFLEAVKRCLGVLEAAEPRTLEEARSRLSPVLVERLSRLRGELNAISAALLDDRGHVFAAEGSLPDGILESGSISALMGALTSSTKISRSLGAVSPHDLLCFEGDKYDLTLAHAGPSFALLVITNKAPGSEYLGTIGFSVHMAAKDIRSVLDDRVARPAAEDRGSRDSAVESRSQIDKPQPGETAGSESDLESIFESISKEELRPEEVDAFWEQLVQDQQATEVVNDEGLSYEQAEELGLTPDENES
jgi:two-component system chemotaxis response regulator CheY